MRHRGGGRSERAARTVLIASAVAMLVGGCESLHGRSTLDPKVQQGVVPASGPAVTLTGVTDRRTFEAAPSDPSVPSLLNAADIQNKSITARAFARKRTGFGKGAGDIVLPESRTVADLVGDAVARGFHQAGYRVVAPAEDGAGQPTPVEVDINAFWCWLTPGAWTLALECKAVLTMATSLPAFAANQVISARVIERGLGATSDDWMEIVTRCLDAISAEVAQRLATSPPPAPASPGPAA